MLKLSRKIFYKNHKNELLKFINPELEIVHILSNTSPSKSMFPDIDELLIDSEKNKEFIKFENLQKKYDLIIITDIFEVSQDIYGFLKNIKSFLKNDGKILLTSINPKWNLVIKFFEILRMKRKSNINSYIHPKKIANVFNSLGFENVKRYNKQVFPFKLFGLGTFLNIFFEIALIFFNLGIKTYFVYQKNNFELQNLSKSIIVPAKNEEGNLEELITRIPTFSEYYEIIISCGPSKDNTFEKANELKRKYKNLNIKVFEQTKNGKANAVWESIEFSECEIIAILDSDISVDPEELSKFFEIIESGNCDFVNGTRLMYKMEDSAMRDLNKIGNRLFQFLISKLISTNLSDTLCGTKVFKRNHIINLYKWQEDMKIKDPFCDFDLIFSTAYFGNKIVEYPVHYRNRKYGTTNISRFRDGWKLILYLINSLFLFKTSYYPRNKY